MAFSVSEEYDGPRVTPAVKWLIGINILVKFLEVTVAGAGMLRALEFVEGDLSGRWWTIITHLFVHEGLWPLIFTVVTLALFGSRLERVLGAGAFVRYYLICGLGGWLAHLMFARDVPLIGAVAADYGVMLAYAVRWPDDEVYLFFAVPIKVKWLVAALAVTSLVFGIMHDGTGSTAHFASLGGFVAGYLYLQAGASGSLQRLKQRVSHAPDISDDPPRAIPRAAPRPRERQDIDDIVARSNKATVVKRPASVPAPRGAPPPTPRVVGEELDLVLDKINRFGMASLTAEERRVLDETSRRLKNRD
jgi:membrane associated rhomboid family serine protease